MLLVSMELIINVKNMFYNKHLIFHFIKWFGDLNSFTVLQNSCNLWCTVNLFIKESDYFIPKMPFRTEVSKYYFAECHLKYQNKGHLLLLVKTLIRYSMRSPS